jgi:hypothetical protein
VLQSLSFQKIKYWRKAQNRHDIHSPFVYGFVEQILNGKWKSALRAMDNPVEGVALNKKQERLLSQIITYYRVSVVNLNEKPLKTAANNPDLVALWIYTDVPDKPINCSASDIVVFLGIHSSKKTFRSWELHCQNTTVRLSLDVFEAGILFFRKDFIVKQHFVLKY